MRTLRLLLHNSSDEVHPTLLSSASDVGPTWGFAEAERKLSELHLGYEATEPWPLEEAVDGNAVSRRDPVDRSSTNNPLLVEGLPKAITVPLVEGLPKAIVSKPASPNTPPRHDIPDETHEYMLGSRSALDWTLERYQIKKDKPSGIVNDPNDWGKEHGDPRYIVDLVKRITRVSVETVAIVKSLPPLDILDEPDRLKKTPTTPQSGVVFR